MPFPRIVKPASARRDELLDAARDLFAERGYDATSVSGIIDRVGVSRGAFYHHFDSKEDLVEALACRFAREAAAEAQAVLDDPTLDSFARLSGYLSRMRRIKIGRARELMAIFEPVLRGDNLRLYQRTQEAVIEVVRPAFVRIIAEGVAERTFDTPDPDGAAEVILHLLSSTRDMVSAFYRSSAPRDREAAAALLIAKMEYLGTVMDRILGLPEGSIELVDGEAIEAMTAAWCAAGTAA
jgi:AcrR family transcriptional regulator